MMMKDVIEQAVVSKRRKRSQAATEEGLRVLLNFTKSAPELLLPSISPNIEKVSSRPNKNQEDRRPRRRPRQTTGANFRLLDHLFQLPLIKIFDDSQESWCA